MTAVSRPTIKTGSGVDLAFAVVVLASYFAAFSALQVAYPLQIVLMIVLGIAYITMGIYGYHYCARRDSPIFNILYFAMQILLGSFIILLSKGSGYSALVLLPLAGHSVILLKDNWVYSTNIVLMIVYILLVRLINGNWNLVWSSLPIFLAGLIFIVVFTQLAVDEEKARTEVERLAKELSDVNQQLREYALQAEDLAITKERNRLAREIHDGLGHYLTIIHMQLQAIRAVLTTHPKRALETLESAQNLTQEALQEIRTSVSSLRIIPGQGLPLQERISTLVNNSQESGIVIAYQVMGTPRTISPQTDLTIFRAAQEGLNNACKHAKAAHIWIELDFSIEKQIRMAIQDDGIGTENLDGGFGLLGLKERVAILNGELKISSSSGEGFRLEILVPE
jgi:signal transduction histidine kinase